ncbi:hypothetical protein JXA80_01240 [bacterium]|nr:hypothetical protein [candidate division CSSED10-310 bacterium]
MRRIHFFIICVFCLVSGAAGADWIPLSGGAAGAEPVATVLKSDDDHTVIAVDIPGFYAHPETVGDTVYHHIVIPESGHIQTIGAPAVPRIVFDVAVPDQAPVAIREIARESHVLTGYLPYPVQKPLTDRDVPNDFIIDKSVYQSDDSTPAQGIALSDPMIWRDVRFVHTTVFPIIANPAARTLTVASRVVYELVYNDGTAINPKTRRDRGVSAALDPMYRRALLNYDALNLPLERHRDTNVKYLIIADDALVASIQPLADWHMQTGLYTELVAASTVGSTSAEFKAFIQTYYDTEGTEYVLLVGETTTVPLGNIGSQSPGDYNYQILEGGDDIADLACGRILTTDPNIVDHVVARTLNYIRTPPLDGWLNKSMLCAHEEQYPGKYTECKEAIRTYAYGIHTMIFDTYYPPEGATHAMVVAAMEEGRGIVNYRGHGDNTYWSWSPGWDLDDVHALNNGAYTPIVWNIACYNGNITISGECLAEAWQNAGSSGEGGAVANIGATEPSYTIANHAFDKMLYRAPLDEGIFRWGYVVDRSKEYMIAEEGQYGIDNSYMYICFGDPAIDMHMMSPITMNVDHLPTAPIGGSDYTVTVSDSRAPIENAMVCILKTDDSLYEVGYTDATGTVALPALLTTGGMMTLTVTSHNALPYTADIIVEAAGCGAILLDRSTYNCNQEILVRVWDSDLNLNPSAADTTTIEISSDSEPTPETLVLTETGPDTAEFAGTIWTSDTQGGAGFLLLAHDDTITAVYHDDDCEGAPRDVNDTAGADCQGPVITGVTVEWVSTNTASLSWTTDEASDTRVFYGTAVPPTTEYYNHRMVTDHAVLLEELDDCTQYRFYVTSTDAGGNIASDNNGGSYYSFTTYELQVFFSDDIESGEGEWTYNGLWHIVPEASACNMSHSPAHSWYYGQEATCTFNTGSTTSGTLTSPIIDLTATTEAELHVWYWFEGESSTTYDTVDISAQIVGGASVLLFTVSAPTGNWMELITDLTPICGNQIQLTFFFDSYDNIANDYQGAYIDDVEIIAAVPCEEPCVNDGDVNNDGAVTAGDAQMAFQIALGLMSPTPEELCSADCNGDLTVTAGDAQQIFMTALGTASCADPL